MAVISAVDWGLLLACVLGSLGLLEIYKRRNISKSPQLSIRVQNGTSTTKEALVSPTEKSPLSPQREPGEWDAVAFNYPSVEPCTDEPHNIKPIPHRPFKWGEYHVTMGIRSMPWNEWFELDHQFLDYHRIREERIRMRGGRIIQVLPTTPGLVGGGHGAAVELVQEMAEYLSRRFPTTYSVKRRDPETDGSGWYGLSSIKEITIIPAGRTYVVDEEEPMALAGILVQDDIAIMIEGSDGRYYLQAGAIVIPGMWRLQDKIGMSLDDIHISGTVPQFESKLQLSMSRFFRRLPVDKPVIRLNYSLQVVKSPEKADPFDPHELSWAKTMKGDEDDVDNKPGFLRAKEDGNSVYSGHFTETSDLANSTEPVHSSVVRMRVERQTLRRLPRTGAVIFGIRTYLTPLEDLVLEPEVPGRLASAIRSWPEDVARYKARSAFESVLDYLDTRHEAQIAAGLASGTRQ